MSTYLDVQTDDWVDDENRQHADWMTLKFEHQHVRFGRDYLHRDGTRRADPEAGISFCAWRLDAVIDALVRLRNDLPALQRQSDQGKGTEK